MTTVHNGLEGIVAAETRLSMVDGAAGTLILAGYRVEDLAPRATFEEVAALFGLRWQSYRFLSETILALLKAAAMPPHSRSVMDALRMATATLEEDDLPAALPTIVASYWRLLHGNEPIAPREDLAYAANYLYMLSGVEPHAELVRGLETYLNTVIDHGLNASTFTARVIASTGSDLVSAITGAIGALKGPLHGGAPGPVLDMLDAIGRPERAEAWVRAELAAGRRIMGMGHRVYRVR